MDSGVGAVADGSATASGSRRGGMTSVRLLFANQRDIAQLLL